MDTLGMIEVLSIPMGVLAADAMLKSAGVSLVTAQAVCAGKYMVLVSGTTAEVACAVRAGEAAAQHTLVDSLVLSNVDERVIAAISGVGGIGPVEAVGVMESFSLAAAVHGADAAVKAADVELIEVRLGRGLGGKSFIVLTGSVSSVRAAVAAAEGLEEVEGMLAHSVVIPAPNPDLVRALL